MANHDHNLCAMRDALSAALLQARIVERDQLEVFALADHIADNLNVANNLIEGAHWSAVQHDRLQQDRCWIDPSRGDLECYPHEGDPSR